MHIKNTYLQICVIVISIALVFIIQFIPDNVSRIFIGLPFVLLFPGFTLISVLFPRKESLGGIERLALSLGLSLAVVPLIGLILNYTFGLNLYSILYSLAGFVWLFSIIAMIRQRFIPENEKIEINIQFSFRNWGPQSTKDKILTAVLVLAIVGIILAIGISAYTGLLLSVIWVHPLWNTLWLPALIMTSAFSMGCILINAYIVLCEDIEKSLLLRKTFTISSVVLITLTGILLIIYLTAVSSGSEIAGESVKVLTSGAASQLFWGIAVGCGLVIPLLIHILLLIKRDLTVRGLLPMLGVVLFLVGAFTLRLIILMAGLPIYV